MVCSCFCIRGRSGHQLLSGTDLWAGSTWCGLFVRMVGHLAALSVWSLLPLFCCLRVFGVGAGAVCSITCLWYPFLQRSRLPRIWHRSIFPQQPQHLHLVSFWPTRYNMQLAQKEGIVDYLSGVMTNHWTANPNSTLRLRWNRFHRHHRRLSWSLRKCRLRDLSLGRRRNPSFARHQTNGWSYRIPTLEMCTPSLAVSCWTWSSHQKRKPYRRSLQLCACIVLRASRSTCIRYWSMSSIARLLSFRQSHCLLHNSNHQPGSTDCCSR